MLENKAAPSLCVTMPGAVRHSLPAAPEALAPECLPTECLIRQRLSGSSWAVSGISQCLLPPKPVPGWFWQSLAGSDSACSQSVLPGCLCTQILRDGRLLVGVSSYFLPDTGQLWEHQAGLAASRIVLDGQCVSLRLRDLLLQSCSCSLLPAASPSPALGSDHSWNS